MNQGEEQRLALIRGGAPPVNGKSNARLTNSLDGDLDAARRRLKGLAAAACRVLDARTLNIASFHIYVYIDAALKQTHLSNSAMGKADADQLRKWWRRFEETEWETQGLREEGAVALVFLKEVPRPGRKNNRTRGR